MFEAVGHHVEKIKRVRYGPLTLDVPPGEFRSLTLKEIERLKSASKSNIGGKKVRKLIVRQLIRTASMSRFFDLVSKPAREMGGYAPAPAPASSRGDAAAADQARLQRKSFWSLAARA